MGLICVALLFCFVTEMSSLVDEGAQVISIDAQETSDPLFPFVVQLLVSKCLFVLQCLVRSFDCGWMCNRCEVTGQLCFFVH